MKKFRSFASYLTRRIVFTVLAIMIVISVLVFAVSTTGMLVFSLAHYSDIMDKARGNMDRIMSRVEVAADNIIDELSWHLATPELVASTIQYELHTNRHLSGCAIAFVPDYFPKQGRWYEPYASHDGDEVLVRDIGSATHDYFHSEWYSKGLTSAEGVWSNPYFDDAGAGGVLCTYSRQVKNPEGEVAGVFGADLYLDELSAQLLEYIKKENEDALIDPVDGEDTAHQIYCFIIGPDGDYIVHPDKERILKTNFYDYAVGEDAEKYRMLGDAMRAGEAGEKVVVMDGIVSEVYYAPLLESGWSMAIVVPVRRLMGPGFLFGTIILVLILLGLLVIFLVCRHFIRKSSRPLIQLAESSREVAMGNFDTPLPEIRTNDEIRLLRDSFDNMQKSLAQYVEELRETTALKASMESELGVARSIQMNMLPMTWPAFPERKDLDIFGSVTPAKAVGGDLYDFRLRDSKLFFCIGDVSGKGVPASLVMTVISAMFRTLSATEDNPARIVSAINASMAARNDSLMFVTLFVGELDLSTGELQYANAGHNAPYVVADGKPRMLEADANVPVGILPECDFSLQRQTLARGEVLFLYTDGLTEAAKTNGELFGEDRVQELLSRTGGQIPVREIILQMTEAVAAFVGDAEQSDDLTMLALRIL